jgi:fatty-acid desaturase
VALALLWLGGLGTTVAYHRSLSHRSLALNPVIEHILIFFAMFNGSGNPLTWVANHRYHHAHSDSEGDVSSPKQGFWWSHLRWLWQAPAAPTDKYCHDMRSKSYRIWGRVQVAVLALSMLSGLVLWPWFGWKIALAGCVWMGALRCMVALHVQCTINSFCHMGQVTKEGGSELNLWWLILPHLGQGENWHFNHHANAANPRLGRGMQLDTGWLVIKALSYVGLATKIKSTAPRPVPIPITTTVVDSKAS